MILAFGAREQGGDRGGAADSRQVEVEKDHIRRNRVGARELDERPLRTSQGWTNQLETRFPLECLGDDLPVFGIVLDKQDFDRRGWSAHGVFLVGLVITEKMEACAIGR